MRRFGNSLAVYEVASNTSLQESFKRLEKQTKRLAKKAKGGNFDEKAINALFRNLAAVQVESEVIINQLKSQENLFYYKKNYLKGLLLSMGLDAPTLL